MYISSLLLFPPTAGCSLLSSSLRFLSFEVLKIGFRYGKGFFFQVAQFPLHIFCGVKCFRLSSGEVPGCRWGLAFPSFSPPLSASRLLCTPPASRRFSRGHEVGLTGRRDEEKAEGHCLHVGAGHGADVRSVFSQLLRAQRRWIVSQPCSFQTACAFPE